MARHEQADKMRGLITGLIFTTVITGIANGKDLTGHILTDEVS